MKILPLSDFLYYNRIVDVNYNVQEKIHMERKVGTVSRGIRCPIIREGDNLADIVVNSVLEAGESEGFEIRDRDVISVTESVVARAQGNYAPIQPYLRTSGQSWEEGPSVSFSQSCPGTVSPSA